MMEQVIANIAELRDYCKQHNILVYYTAQPKEQSDEDRALLNDMGAGPDPFAGTAKGGGSPDARCRRHGAGEVARYSAFHRSPLEQNAQREWDVTS